MTPRAARRRPTALLVRAVAVQVLGVAVLVAGCAGVPTESAVRQGDEVLTGGQDDPFVRVLARPPADGMTQRQIVAGFLEASASFDGDHAVARQYLAPEVRQQWDPASGTVVYEGSALALTEDPAANTVEVSAPQVAAISGHGEYDPAPAGAAMAARFALRLVDDQWRIATAPSGLALTPLDVSRAYRAYNVFFLDPTGTRLVPDRVFVPIQQAGIATSLVRSVLAGPTPWLAPAVSTAVPDGTVLTVDSVPVADRVARIDLSRQALDSTPDARERMSAQLAWTLRQLPEVARLDLTVNGVDFAVPGVANPQPIQAWDSYDPDGFPQAGPAAYAVRDGAVVVLDDPVREVSGALGATAVGATRVAVTAEGDRVAAVVSGPRLLVGAFDAPTEVAGLTAASVTALSWDPLGAVWVTGAAGGPGTGVWAVGVDGAARPVRAPELDGRQVSVVRVARDGCRAAVLATDPGGSVRRLYLARVLRAADGALTLEGLRRLESSLGDVSDVAWRDASRLVALAADGAGERQPYVVPGDGAAVRVASALPGSSVLTAAPGSPLVVGSDDGRLWVDTGSEWAELGPGSAPAYPG